MNSKLPGQIDGDSENLENEKLDKSQEQRQLLHEVTQETRFNIIQTILMHPKQLPSLKEVAYMHPDRSQATLREHLEKLREISIVAKLELSEERQSRDSPKVFYGLTGEGREILEEFGLLDIEETLQYMYDNMKKPKNIQEYEEAARPEMTDDNSNSAKTV